MAGRLLLLLLCAALAGELRAEGGGKAAPSLFFFGGGYPSPHSLWGGGLPGGRHEEAAGGRGGTGFGTPRWVRGNTTLRSPPGEGTLSARGDAAPRKRPWDGSEHRRARLPRGALSPKRPRGLSAPAPPAPPPPASGAGTARGEPGGDRAPAGPCGLSQAAVPSWIPLGKRDRWPSPLFTA